ncbi:phenylacetate--CoA ligase family protein [Roseococcus sp. YIM B11640]|uniref:phenylacetate--CoA ligase family protein n=1 Tax=Roseococcus sp. YIM B11640 TaxID=3133973 RepID=UPI003C79DADD
MTQLAESLRAALALPGWRAHLGAVDPAAAQLRDLPVLRKSGLPAMQKAAPPFAGFATAPAGFARLFASPGPIFEGMPDRPDPWRFAPALAEAGIGAGTIVLNCLAYHLTPGGFIFDSAARSLGAAVIPGGPGNTEALLHVLEAYRPGAYTGTPDFLKILLEAADRAGIDASCITCAVVSGAAFPPSLREWVAGRGIKAIEAYGTAELGLIAHGTADGAPGMAVAPGIVLEIVRPGTGEPLPEGEVGEVVVTVPDPAHPILRFSPGDMSAFLPGGARIKGWMGRADQTAKVKGMFVRPEQIAEIGRLHPALGRLRLVVTRQAEVDEMRLLAESAESGLEAALAETLRAVTKLRGAVELRAPGSLPADGRVIVDERPV